MEVKMKIPCYKSCAVPMCKSTTISTPKKLFIHVPKNENLRINWFTLARRRPMARSSTSYFCEDHFNLENDMENYTQYTTMGVVSQVKLRPGCLPTKFACQEQSGNTSTNTIPSGTKRKKLTLVSKDIRAVGLEQSENCNITSTETCEPVATKNKRLKLTNESELKSATLLKEIQNLNVTVSKDPLLKLDINKIDKEVQVKIAAKYRSKSSQTRNISCTKQTSPIKLSTKSVSTSPFKITDLKQFLKPQQCRSGVTGDLLNDDKSDSDVSLYTPSVALITKTSSDTSSCEAELKNETNIKCILQHTIVKIRNRPQFYIGVPKNCYFLINIIHEHTGIPVNHILLCLKKIRLDTKFSELSDEFGITISCASKVFKENISKIAKVMRPFIVNLEKTAIKRCLPIAFRKNYHKTTCIIDCLEIEIQKPGKALHQALTWSEYKKVNTIKYLISSTPNGLVNYISQGYGGRISDVCLVENCNFLNCLPSGSQIMADRGFKHIEPLLLGIGCKLIRPPSIISGNKLSKNEVKETKKIASLRIHIERIIRRIREFAFLKPHACTNSNFLGKLDDVIVIASGLINLQTSLINK